MKNIAILLPDLSGGGAERVMIDLGREFSRLGFQVEFVLMAGKGDLLAATQQDFKVVNLDVSRTRQSPRAFARYLRERRPDAVIANIWPLTSAAVFGRALSTKRCRLLLVEHNTLTEQYSSWGRLHFRLMTASITLTHRFADAVAAVSDGAAKDLARLAKLSNERVMVLHNPISQRNAPESDLIAKTDLLWGCPPGKRILTVGSLKDQKNHSLLLSAFEKLKCTNSRLMILGQGKRLAILREMAAELGIKDRVIFAGFHPDPAPFYATADLFVLSSDYEGFGNVIVEALAMGTPVVSTDCPSGPAEILEGGKWGRLTPVGDANKLAEAISAALLEDHNHDLLKRRAADFSPELAARKYLDLMDLT